MQEEVLGHCEAGGLHHLEDDALQAGWADV